MGVIVFFVDVYHKLFWNDVDWFRERYDGDLILFNQVEVPCLNKKKLKFHLTLGDNFECFREVLESLTLFCSFFNSLIWAELKSTHFQYSVSVDYKSYNVILMPRHEICGATDNIFCQFIMKRHGMDFDVVSSRGNWWTIGMFFPSLQRVLQERQGRSYSIFQSRLTCSCQTTLSLSLDLLRHNWVLAEAVIRK